MQGLFIFVLGFIIGCLFVIIARRVKSIGALRVDRTDPDGPYIFLELDKDEMPVLTRQTYVLMRVYLRDYISHK